MTGRDIALAAEALVGTRFRLHGRSPETGLDCIGLIAVTVRSAGATSDLPNGYSLRTGRWPDLQRFAASLGFVEADLPVEPGDIALFNPSPAQMHFAIAATRPGRWVEAHAGLRRVVISSISLPLQALWRQVDRER